MSRYLVFGFSHYYPGGGMNDVVFKSSNFLMVKDVIRDWEKGDTDIGKHYENLHVYDVKNDKVIYVAEFDVKDYMKNSKILIVETPLTKEEADNDG